jgi:hypothetical protein
VNIISFHQELKVIFVIKAAVDTNTKGFIFAWAFKEQ